VPSISVLVDLVALAADRDAPVTPERCTRKPRRPPATRRGAGHPGLRAFHADKPAALHNVGQLVTHISMAELHDA
jgi:hypothetical protein